MRGRGAAAVRRAVIFLPAVIAGLDLLPCSVCTCVCGRLVAVYTRRSPCPAVSAVATWFSPESGSVVDELVSSG